ncbi:hypothetical protein G5A69_05725 [Ralstonia mannitolilytica]|nr:hypothetical protein G5A69_05725 [Ralstonia mannitolilytica]
MTGDVLKSIEGLEITDGRGLQQLLRKLGGQEVKIEILRDGKALSKQVKLNPVPQ